MRPSVRRRAARSAVEGNRHKNDGEAGRSLSSHATCHATPHAHISTQRFLTRAAFISAMSAALRVMASSSSSSSTRTSPSSAGSSVPPPPLLLLESLKSTSRSSLPAEPPSRGRATADRPRQITAASDADHHMGSNADINTGHDVVHVVSEQVISQAIILSHPRPRTMLRSRASSPQAHSGAVRRGRGRGPEACR
jgi:hypothetical protein